MKKIQQGFATTLCIMTITFLIMMPFILETAADNWSDCDGNGNGYKHSLNACVEASNSAYNECSSAQSCEVPWWVTALIQQQEPFWTDPCEPFKAACAAAERNAARMCKCDS